jgi:hypothetical protein
MTDHQQGGGAGGWGQPPAGSPGPGQVGQPAPGWYPDPWARGQHRYWNGQVWTGDAFPHGPAEPSTGYPAAPAPGPSYGASMPSYLGSAGERTEAPPPPGWSPPPTAGSPPNPPTMPNLPVPVDERTRPPRRQVIAILLLVPLLVGLSSFAGFYLANRGRSRAAAENPPPLGTSPNSPGPAPGTTLPAGLAGVGLTQSDVGSGITVQKLDNGDQVSAQAATLDLCNGTFPSESLRTARLQVVAVDGQGNSLISTETVTYSNAAGTARAFSELATTATKCPASPVTSPIGEQTVTTHFNTPPDGTWPQVATVQRLAFDFVTTDASGQDQHSVAVYLRRGRVLLGVYFNQPDGAQPSVAGQTTIAGIVNVFATRMAQLPDSVVNG